MNRTLVQREERIAELEMLQTEHGQTLQIMRGEREVIKARLYEATQAAKKVDEESSKKPAGACCRDGSVQRAEREPRGSLGCPEE